MAQFKMSCRTSWGSASCLQGSNNQCRVLVLCFRTAQLEAAIKEKKRAGVLLLQDNAPHQTAQVAVAAATECGFELLPHPSCSPGLASSNFYLFSKIKFYLRGHCFETDDDVIQAVEAYLKNQDEIFFQEGIGKLEHRWTMCIELRGYYV
uniref:Histone-lysine N-methyltransferase SETMAR-like n=1 Tax=Saccoglossus kowalevskii TaxID=10224 RepID=A0ABM0MZ57_SACKO|nr:PREDICTED: histone-lysine N-methyltransferase SETMAR-like [Saccoglossus kowalevskii]